MQMYVAYTVALSKGAQPSYSRLYLSPVYVSIFRQSIKNSAAQTVCNWSQARRSPVLTATALVNRECQNSTPYKIETP